MCWAIDARWILISRSTLDRIAHTHTHNYALIQRQRKLMEHDEARRSSLIGRFRFSARGVKIVRCSIRCGQFFIEDLRFFFVAKMKLHYYSVQLNILFAFDALRGLLLILYDSLKCMRFLFFAAFSSLRSILEMIHLTWWRSLKIMDETARRIDVGAGTKTETTVFQEGRSQRHNRACVMEAR